MLEASWQQIVGQELEQEYIAKLREFLRQEKAANKIIYPANKDIFNAFTYTPFNQVKIVILGQDPYHGVNQAMGLSFSVPSNVKPPPSLMNIYRELLRDVGITMPKHGDLTKWAKQGVLLLNSVLTVEKSLASSHQGKGWELFTDAVIKALNEQKEHIVFMLWGKYAKEKGAFIDRTKHLVLEAPHPSPFSAHTGFLGCSHFSKANSYLKEHNIEPIDWSL